MSLITEAFKQLYPETELSYETELNYSKKFKPYNANVKLIKHENKLIFNFSHKWKEVSEEISIGLIQELLVKILKDRNYTRTMSMDLYNIFIKKLHIAVPKIHSEPILESSFNRMNELYFNGLLEKPNLKWGKNSFTKLGSYEYANDIITISKIFKDSDTGLLDNIMYHEMLHKWLKFDSRNGRSIHHSVEFRKREKAFEGYESVEKRLKEFIRRKRKIRWIFGVD